MYPKLPTAGDDRADGKRLTPEVRAALVLAVRRDVVDDVLASAVRACDGGQLASAAIDQGVAGAACERLAGLLPERERQQLVARAKQDALMHFKLMGDLGLIGAALDGSGISWAVLKGPILTELSYGHTSRGYSDLDILVRSSELTRSVEALGRIGVTAADRNWPLLLAQQTGELTMRLRGAPMVDLHWHLVNKSTARARFRLPSDEVLDRRQPVRLGSVRAWSLDPTDFVAHVALHTSLSGADRLRWLVDIDRTLASRPPHWDLLVERCRSWRVGLPVAVALRRAAVTLGAPVRPGALEAMVGRRLHRMAVAGLGNWVEAGRMPEGRSVLNSLTRCLRDNLVTTAVEFARDVADTVGDVARGRELTPDDPLHPFHEAGGTSGFADYTTMVTRSNRYGHWPGREATQSA